HQGERFRGGWCRFGKHAKQTRLACKDSPVRLVVIHEEYALASQDLELGEGVAPTLDWTGLGRTREMEGGALVDLCIDPHFAPHGGHETLGDGEPEPRASES